MILLKMPMPCSVNAYLKPRQRDGRLCKTEAAILFDKIMMSYKMRNFRDLDLISKGLKVWISQDKFNVIKLRRVYHFCEKRVFTKTKGSKCQLQELDTENFLKLNSDAIALMLDIDDRYFKNLEVTTAVIDNSKAEFIDVEFLLSTIIKVGV